MYEVASQSSEANRPVLVHSCCRLGRTANPPRAEWTSMMCRLFWPLSWVLVLEGYFLNLPLGWMVAAAAIASFGYLVYEAIRAHRALDEIIARMNDRPDLDCEAQHARGIPRNPQPDETSSFARPSTAVRLTLQGRDTTPVVVLQGDS
jgi:hypothetical protein